ncbi:hypothetical protein BKA67DRAFT_653139 [Truncatella angustata]|uniref:Uncharacterized protein n=1 Tax=Truncatella angustata TaxID=152316 RepID=A0A9P8UVE3_9PEZI|nr:uncharacterized protein BKA67DRAFT_653139 [Truncatella angustata]KAH6659934.1 hypothetical protein BKA67DRAFT_653139 [Truncatella angustata]KAH8197947.1 hypothetical protein TruAng_007897 [Truncatella angustata]
MPEQDNNGAKPVIVFPEDGKRPHVDKYGITYKYRPTDRVYLTPSGVGAQEGPYYIFEAKDGQYSLSENGSQAIKNGQLFKENELTLYDPF